MGQHASALVMLPADIMKFNGAAPELVNGRLAMIGIVAAATKEVQTSQTVLQQVQTAPLWWWGVLLLWVWASLVPISKGARHEAFGESQLSSPTVPCLINLSASSCAFAVLQICQALLRAVVEGCSLGRGEEGGVSTNTDSCSSFIDQQFHMILCFCPAVSAE
jgi:hypothetical protein